MPSPRDIRAPMPRSEIIDGSGTERALPSKSTRPTLPSASGDHQTIHEAVETVPTTVGLHTDYSVP